MRNRLQQRDGRAPDRDEVPRMRRWWQGRIGYEIYVRSFLDADGDGVGDLAGVRRRLDYLADLGVEVIWLTPFYPSPQADHGYDVADYRGVDPRLGTLADADALVEEVHARGMRVLFDLVPNHTSDRHPWFLDARSSRDARHRDWYVWRDPAPDGGPPNNWLSHFGGPAWTYDEATGQYYMHLFLPEQPDLNWANPEVRAEFEDILDWWFSRGVDGVRIDVAHSLAEDPEYRDNPEPAGGLPADLGPREAFAAFEHVHDLDQDEVLEIYRGWNEVAERHDALLLGEVYLLDPARVGRYVADGKGLHAAFCFPALRVAWEADGIRDTLRRCVEELGDAAAWPLSSHDDPRAVTRFGDGDVGRRRALAYLAFLGALPGMPFLLQGDELGLPDGRTEVRRDPIALRNDGEAGRDGSRTPMPWEPGPAFGFTSGIPWLAPGGNRTDADTVARQTGLPGSPLERARELLAVRRRLADRWDGAGAEWLTDAGPVVAVRRGPVVAAMHVGAGTARLGVPAGADLVYATADGARVEGGVLSLPHDATAYLLVPS